MVSVEKRVEQMVALVHECSHIITENVVEAHVAEAKLLMALSQLSLPVRAQRQWRMPTADGMLPKMRQRCRLGQQAAGKLDIHEATRLVTIRAAAFQTASALQSVPEFYLWFLAPGDNKRSKRRQRSHRITKKSPRALALRPGSDVTATARFIPQFVTVTALIAAPRTFSDEARQGDIGRVWAQ